MESDNTYSVVLGFDSTHIEHIDVIQDAIEVAGTIKTRVDSSSDAKTATAMAELIDALQRIKRDAAKLVVTIAEQRTSLQPVNSAPGTANLKADVSH